MLSARLNCITHKTSLVYQARPHTTFKQRVAAFAECATTSMPDQVVICGGGIIGVATAYYLTLQGVKPIVVEKSSIACAASGDATKP